MKTNNNLLWALLLFLAILFAVPFLWLRSRANQQPVTSFGVNSSLVQKNEKAEAKLERELAAVRTAWEEKQNAQRAANQFNPSLEELKALRAQVAKQQSELTSLQAEHTALTDTHSAAVKQLAELTESRDAMQLETSRLSHDKSEANARVVELQQSIAQRDEIARTLELALAEARNRVAEQIGTAAAFKSNFTASQQQLRERDANLLSLSNSANAIKEQLAASAASESDLRHQLIERKATSEMLRSRLMEVNLQLDDLKGRLKAKSDLASKMEADYVAERETALATVTAYEKTIAELSKNETRLADQHEETTAKLEASIALSDELKAELSSANNRVATLREQVEERKTAAANLQASLRNAETELRNQAKALSANQTTIERFQTTKSQLTKNFENASTELANSKAASANLASKLTKADEQIDELQIQLANRQQFAKKLQEELANAKSTIDEQANLLATRQSAITAFQANETKLKKDWTSTVSLLNGAHTTSSKLEDQLSAAEVRETDLQKHY